MRLCFCEGGGKTFNFCVEIRDFFRDKKELDDGAIIDTSLSKRFGSSTGLGNVVISPIATRLWILHASCESTPQLLPVHNICKSEVNHCTKLIQTLIGLYIKIEVLMRGLRQILSSKDMSLGDKAYVKSIESIQENSSYKENGEEASKEGALWFHMDCISKQSDLEFCMLKKSDHTVGNWDPRIWTSA